MPVLDSDSLSNLFTEGRTYPSLRKRVLEVEPALLFVTIISVEESLRGYLNRIQQDREKDSISQRYQALQNFLHTISGLQILPFDANARAIFDQMPAKAKRQGSQDCRIAAIAISRGLTVITRNLSDFQRIPGVLCEDWTAEPQT